MLSATFKGLTNNFMKNNIVSRRNNVNALSLRWMTMSSSSSVYAVNATTIKPEYIMYGYRVLMQDERALTIDVNGNSKYHDGPQNIALFRKRYYKLQPLSSTSDQYLRINYKNGDIQHQNGACRVFIDPILHSSVEICNKIQVNSGYSIAVYNKDNDDNNYVTRRVINGPCQYMFEPNEWLHSFYWYVPNQDKNQRANEKNRTLLKFNKLRTVPDQLYMDIDGVRTKDDAVITVQLMVFFHLQDIDKMLDSSHDPSKEMMNVITSDIMDMSSIRTFDEFKLNVDIFSDANNYKQTLNRLNEIGYNVIKIAFRGYVTTEKLQNMHNNAIEERTQLQLEYEKETQQQQIQDIKQLKEFEREEKKRANEIMQIKHDVHTKDTQITAEIEQNQRKQQDALLQKEKLFKQQIQFDIENNKIKLQQQKNEFDLEIEKEKFKQEYLLSLTNQTGLDITKYFVSLHQQTPDKCIKIEKNTNGNDDIYVKT